MSEFLDEIERYTSERIANGDAIDKQFWHLFSYCKGLEYTIENLGKLGEAKMKEAMKEDDERIR